MASLNGLPVFFIKIDESLDSNQGIDMISCVDYPAIESNFVALKDAKRFAFNQDKQMLYGAILIPDQPIYRNDPKMGEYYVVFKEEEIIKMVRKFQAQQKTINLNYQHQKDSQIKNAVIQEIWLTGKSDKSQDFGFNFPMNTAVIGAYIGDSKFWNEEVKSGNVKGFSIEGFLDMYLKENMATDLILAEYPGGWDQCVIDMTGKYGDKGTAEKVCGAIKNGTVQHSKQNKHKFMDAKTKDGQYTISTTDDTFKVGSPVTITAADGTTVTDGSFDLDNNTTIDVAGGKVTEVADTTSDTAEEGVAPLSEAETKVIQSAMKSIIKPLEDKIAELELKLSQKPGAAPITNTPEPEVKLGRLEFIRQTIKKHNDKTK